MTNPVFPIYLTNPVFPSILTNPVFAFKSPDGSGSMTDVMRAPFNNLHTFNSNQGGQGGQEGQGGQGGQGEQAGQGGQGGHSGLPYQTWDYDREDYSSPDIFEKRRDRESFDNPTSYNGKTNPTSYSDNTDPTSYNGNINPTNYNVNDATSFHANNPTSYI